MSKAQDDARREVARALNAAKRAGLALRVFDGSVYLLNERQMAAYHGSSSGRIGDTRDMSIQTMIDEEALVPTRIDADGGAGW